MRTASAANSPPVRPREQANITEQTTPEVVSASSLLWNSMLSKTTGNVKRKWVLRYLWRRHPSTQTHLYQTSLEFLWAQDAWTPSEAPPIRAREGKTLLTDSLSISNVWSGIESQGTDHPPATAETSMKEAPSGRSSALYT